MLLGDPWRPWDLRPFRYQFASVLWVACSPHVLSEWFPPIIVFALVRRTSMWKNALEWWNSYKYRFVPWLAIHLRNRCSTIQSSLSHSCLGISQNYLPFRSLLKAEKACIPPAELQATVAELVKYLDGVPVRTALRDPFAPLTMRLKEMSSYKLSDFMGFSLIVRKSRIPKAGRGVFVEVRTHTGLLKR